jgi:hypothetical protein
MEMEKEITMLQ